MIKISILITLLISASISAHETEDITKLKTANDVLTIRVSELLAENKHLKAFAKNALIAKSQGKKVRSGCEPQLLRELLVMGNGKPSGAERWLKENNHKCEKKQLSFIYNEIESWSEYSMSNTRRLISYYKDNM